MRALCIWILLPRPIPRILLARLLLTRLLLLALLREYLSREKTQAQRTGQAHRLQRFLHDGSPRRYIASLRAKQFVDQTGDTV
jgi:hypothetical protein